MALRSARRIEVWLRSWLKRGPSARSREGEAIMQAVKASFVASARTYGARRIWRNVLEAGRIAMS
jgi:putative transposase